MNFQNILREYGIPFREHGEHHHVTKGWINLDCPWCSPNSGRFRLGHNLEYGFLSCWTCGFHPIERTLIELTRETRDKVKELLGVDELKKFVKRTTKKGNLVIPREVGLLSEAHNNYLEKRGLDPKHLSQFWGIKGIGIASRLSWRLWIPIHYRGSVVSWTTRSINNDSKKRYITAGTGEESIPAKHLLYGEDHVRHAIIVVEGPVDVWKIGPGATALMGTSWTHEQIEKIAQYPVRIICLDKDARDRSAKLCKILRPFKGITKEIELETGKDAGESSGKEIQELRKKFLE